MLLGDLLSADRIKVPLESRDKPSVMRELVDVLVRATGAEPGEVLRAVKEREDCLSTGFGFGVAVPHGRTPALGSLAVVAGRSGEPIDFRAVDGLPVRLFFLVAGPESAAGEQVRALGRIARLVRRDYMRERLLKATSAEEFAQIVREAEAH